MKLAIIQWPSCHFVSILETEPGSDPVAEFCGLMDKPAGAELAACEADAPGAAYVLHDVSGIELVFDHAENPAIAYRLAVAPLVGFVELRAAGG